jgi:hypothetical protein
MICGSNSFHETVIHIQLTQQVVKPAQACHCCLPQVLQQEAGYPDADVKAYRDADGGMYSAERPFFATLSDAR